MYVDNMTLVNTRKAMLVNSSIEEEIALLPGAASEMCIRDRVKAVGGFIQD